jgi:hypothetical protein
LCPPFRRVLAAARAARLTEIEESTSYGAPALKLRGKLLVRMKDAYTMVLLVPLADKETLMATAPAIYFETDHYKGWPAVLVRMAAISDAELRLRLEQSWRHRAPRRLVAERDASRENEAARRARRAARVPRIGRA